MDKELMEKIKSEVNKISSMDGKKFGLFQIANDWEIVSQLSKDELVRILKELDYALGSNTSKDKYNMITDEALESIEKYLL